MYRRFGGSQRVETLKGVPVFSGCTNGELRRIAALTTSISARAGEPLTVTSEPGCEFFIIISGTATVWRNGIRIDSMGSGSFFGELALLNSGIRSASVVAETDMKLLVSTRSEFYNPGFLIPSVTRKMLAVTSQRLCRAVEEWARTAASAEQEPEINLADRDSRALAVSGRRDQ